ncbi:MAG: LysM peptidoglycan-binding domain-containing protein [Bacillota bacterium]|nr:LysM peptidoglycan-binding domain-containing protein [Bacillota bacterium]
MYTIFLDGVALPVAPSKISMKIKNQNKTINLINDGEINILKSAGLTEVSFEAILPQVKYPFAVYPDGFKEADFYLDKLEQLKDSRSPFQFVCSRVTQGGKLLFDTNITVSLESYDVTDDAGEGLDITVSIELKQYREYTTKTVQLNDNKTAATVETARDTATAPKMSTYTVKKGDLLWNIAKKYLGNGARYTEIYALNKDKIKDPSLIYPGQVLTMPS